MVHALHAFLFGFSLTVAKITKTIISLVCLFFCVYQPDAKYLAGTKIVLHYLTTICLCIYVRTLMTCVEIVYSYCLYHRRTLHYFLVVVILRVW